MPTLLKKSPDKRENLLSSFPNVESIPEDPSITTPTSLATPTIMTTSVELTAKGGVAMSSNAAQAPPISPPTNNDSGSQATIDQSSDNRQGSTTNTNSTSTLSSLRHKRSHSMDFSFQSSLQRPSLDSSVSYGSQWSVESISLLSENPSELSYETAYTAPLSPAHPPGETSGCFQFKSHFSMFSQYTSNLALEYNTGDEGKGDEVSLLSDQCLSSLAPPIWCLDVLNGTAAIGCGNGQIEVNNYSVTGIIITIIIIIRCGTVLVEY